MTKPPGSNLNLERSSGAYWVRLTRWENGTRTVAPVDLRDTVPTSKDLSELPSVEDTIDVATEDAEANVPTTVSTPKEPGAVERSRHELTHMPCRFLCFSCVAGRGADDPHRKSDSYSGPPKVECDDIFLSGRVHPASDVLTIFNMIDSESQSMAAVVTVKAASDILVRFFQAMLDAWERSEVKVLLRSDQEVTLSLILREVQARRQQRTLVERSPAESHATVGAMERANWILGEMLHTRQHATETRVGGRLETDHSLSSWMVRHCCWIFCRFHVGDDGRTTFGVLRKNSYRGGLACSGEVDWARVLGTRLLRGKYEVNWLEL